MHAKLTRGGASVNSPCLMFRKFTLEDISTQNQVKSSIQRGIRGVSQVICLLFMATSSRLSIPRLCSKPCDSRHCVQLRYAHHILSWKRAGPLSRSCRRKSRHSWQSCKHFHLTHAPLVSPTTVPLSALLQTLRCSYPVMQA